MADPDQTTAVPAVADVNPYTDAINKQAPPPPPDPVPPTTEPTDDNPYASAIEQQAGAKKALLASSMSGAAETNPEHQSKVVALADKLGLSSDVIEKNYDAINARVQLQDRDYNKLLQHHPELAAWLSVPENAQVAHDEVPQIQQMDALSKSLAGIPHDITGALPDGFMFKKDGTIRGPLHADGTPPVVYKNIEAMRQVFARDVGQQNLDRLTTQAMAEKLKDRFLPSVQAGIEGSIAETLGAGMHLLGGHATALGLTGDELTQGAGKLESGAELLNPGVGGSLGRIAGHLIGDAPLYLLGGEVAGLTELGSALKSVKAATALPLVPKSEYLADVWKTALAYSPIAARSGINTGAENGAAYGSVDFLINSLGPAAFGSKLGLAHAIVPGAETEAAGAGWAGVAGRLMLHVGSQGGIMATTELANALHEYASGVDPDALNSKTLLPRLAQAGAMGSILSGAFHLPGAIGDHMMRQQVSAHAAMIHADALGAFMESAEAIKAAERSPGRFEQLLKGLIPNGQRNKFFQGEDFEGVAKAANLSPEDLATQMGIGDEYKRALATGQMMTVPTHLLLKWGMEHEDPVVKKALLTAARSSAVGINANEALKFYEETPDQLAKHEQELQDDVSKAAKELPESDPIYQDILAKYEEAGQIPDAARANAKLMAAAENTLAARHNAEVKASGKGKLVDAFEEYQSRLKAVNRGDQAHPVEAFDAMLDRVRDGNVPTEKETYGKSLVEFLEKRGVKDPTGELAKAGAEKVIDANGHDLEVAAERAHDEGYIEDAEPATLVDALKREFAGRTVFSAQNRNEELHQLRTAVVGLAQHMASKGIDPSRSNDEIKAALAGDETMARMQQSVTLRTGKESLKKYGIDSAETNKTRDIAVALEKRQREKYGTVAPDDRSPEAQKKIAKFMAQEVAHEMANPEKSGVGWYGEKFQRALDTLSERFPELKGDRDARDLMTALIAVTSDGQKVVGNFKMASDIYGNFRKTGTFSTAMGHSRQSSIQGNIAEIQRLHDKLGAKGIRDFLMQEMTISQLKKIAKAAGGEMKSDYQAHIKMPMAAVVFGPKLGAFYANLMGADGYLTMDRWWSRTFNRYRGTLLQAPTAEGIARFKQLLGNPEMSDEEAVKATIPYRNAYAERGFKGGSEIERAANTIHKAAYENLEDAPFNATDRTFMLDTVKRAQDLLAKQGMHLSVADIQATLWYYEKRLYAELGARESADISYEEAARRALDGGADADSAERSAAPGDRAAEGSDAGSVVGDAHEGVPGRVEQPSDEGARGSLEWSAARHFTMTLNGNADLSTVAHEAGHYFFERMGDYATREDASPQIKADYEKMLEFTGYGTHEQKLEMLQDAALLQAKIVREGREPTAYEQKRLATLAAPHEKFARAIEQYLMEGHAPSPELRPVLQRFAIWLTAIYKSVKDLVTLTPEVKGVFDRLLATDDAITQVQQELGTSTIFKDQASSGMDDASWGKYLKSVQRERERAQANVFAKAMKTLRRENTRAYNREVDKATVAAANIVRARPVNIAVGEMVNRVDARGNEISEVPKLSRSLIVKEYGSIARMPRGITQEEGGLSLEVAAEHYGFSSAEEMWTALANYKKPHEQIRELADQIVRAQHPELTPEGLHQAAMEAVHANNAHADVLSQESAALAIHALKRPIPQEQMKAIAERMVDETNHQDVNPEAHLRAEQRASDASTKAFLEVPPDYTAAFLHKQRQELSHALYRASMEAQEVIEDCTKLMKRMRKTDSLSMLGHAGGFVITGKNGERLITSDAAEAQALATQYEGTVENYLQSMTRMLEVWNDRPTRFDMDYGAIHDFYREAAAIQYQAKQAFDIITGDRKEKLADVLLELTSRQEDVAKGKVVIVPRDKKGFAWLSKTWLRQFDAGNRTLAAIAMELDGGRPGGPHWEHIVRPLNDAANDEQIRRIHNSQEMTNLIKAWGKRGRKESVYVPAVGEHLSLETRIGVALNAGTKPNLERMMTGDGWDRTQIAAIIMTLDKSDLELVKGIWAHLEKKWPEISALHQKLTGIPPAKKETLPIETAFGTLEGGYYPILYDKDVSARAFELTLDKPTNPTLGQPRSGFTQKTVETTGLRLQYGFSALFRHDADTAHYLSHAEAAANLNKILNSPDFRENVVRRFGMETYKAMTERVRNVLEGPRGPQNAFERAVRFIRQRSGLATIGYSAMTVAVHGFGVPQSMHRVGAAEWMAAQGQLIASAGSLESGYAFIDTKSSFMREGRHNFTPEMDERISQGMAGGVLQQVQDHALDGLHMALRVINSATWMAEYKTRIAENPADDARAVALADQAVRDTQGGGQTVDKTRYQDANEFSRVFMQYAIFFTRTYQMLRPGVTGVLDNPRSPDAYWAAAKAFLVLVALPAAAETAFKQLVKPSPGDSSSAKFWAERLAKANLEYLLSTVMGGREIAGVLDGNQFGGPASSRSVASMASAVGALRGLVNDPSASKAGKAGRSALAMTGLLFGIPSNQIDHIIQGIIHDREHRSANPAPILFGPPPKH